MTGSLVADATARVAVLSRSFSKNQKLRAELGRRYANIRFNDGDTTLSGEALTAFIGDSDRIVVALEKITPEVLDSVPGVKVISKYGVGIDNVDLHACATRGIRVGWTGGVNRRSVAELSIAFMITLLRHVVPGMTLIQSGGFRQLVGRQLTERTVGVIGCGHVGQELTRLLRAFGTTVLAHDIRDVSDFCASVGAEAVDLAELLARSDIVTLHVPLTPKTRHMIDAAALAALPDGAIVINTARGGVVDEAALVAAMQAGKISGAALDVFEIEPPYDRTFASLPNAIATPHIGGSAEEAIFAMGMAAIEGLETAGDPLQLVPDYLRG